MDADRLRLAESEQAYTRQLIAASRGYDRANAAEIAFES
jgi:hypothetical protein